MENANAESQSDADQAEVYNEQCHRWKLQLDEANDFSDVAAVCQDICNYAGRTAGTGMPESNLEPMLVNDAADGEAPDRAATGAEPNSPSSILTRTLLANLKDANKTHSQRKIISKSYYNLCHRNVLEGAPLEEVYGVSDLGKCDENSVAIYGMLNSRFLAHMQTLPTLASVAARNLALFLSPAAGYNRWFNTVSENVLTIERLNLFRNVHTGEQYERMWHIVLTNLESPYHGARENMLALLKYLVKDERFMRQIVVPELSRWSWINRNKFHLLVILLGQYKVQTLMALLHLDTDLLGGALRLSLKYKHLHTGGQALVRLLHKEQRMTAFVFDLVATVIIEEEHDLVQVMAKYWFSCFTPKDYRTVYRTHINLEHVITVHFEELGVENLFPPYCKHNKHEKLFLLAFLFRRELQKHAYLKPFLLHLCDLADRQKPLPPATLGLLIESLGYYIIACGATERINTYRLTTHLTRYMVEVMETPGHLAVCNTIVTVCRNLLKHIVHIQQRPPSTGKEFNRDAQALVAKFMSYDMYDRYLLPPGTKPVDYQPTITALRLFAAFVEQFFEFTPSSQYVLQMRPTEKVAWIAKLLPASLPLDELASSFRSMVYGLQHHLRSEFDDVRLITLKMLYNRPVAYHFDPKLQDQLAIVFSRGDDTDTVRQKLHQLLADTIGKVRDAIHHHKQDFFAAVLAEDDQPNGQLHRLIDRCTEICFGFPDGRAALTNAELFRVHDCVMEVWQLASYAMRCAKQADEPYYGTSFELMERCLQMLLEQSHEWKTNHAPGCIDSSKMGLAKRRMLVALWKTSRAVSTFIEHSALWIVENNKETENSHAFGIFQGYLQTLTTIITTACHRGAIEAGGNCLSRVVRQLMHLKQNVLTGETGANSARFRPLKRYTAEIKRMCETMLEYPQQHLDDFRRHRGYIWMLHSCMRSDAVDIVPGSPLRMYLEEHMQLAQRAADHEREQSNDETVPPVMMVLWLHQLNLLARETVLNESILPHIDELMILALAHIRSPQWPIRNAALQLYSSCAAKLTGQRQQYKDPDADWAPVYTSFDEVAAKANRTMEFMLRQLKTLLPLGERSPDEHDRAGTFPVQRDPVTPFLLLVLEFISKLEYRGYRCAAPENTTYTAHVHKYRAILWQLLRHEHDQVRKLAARSFAQLHDHYAEIPNLLEHMIRVLFTSRDSNFRQGLCQAIMACIQKYVTLERFGRRNQWIEEQQHQHRLPRMKDVILKAVREMVGRHYMLDREINFVSTFRFRCELHKLLLYLRFPRDCSVVMELIINRLAPNMHGLDVFAMQLNQVYNSGLSTVPETEPEPSAARHHHLHQQQPHSMPYELFLELDRELLQEPVEEV